MADENSKELSRLYREGRAHYSRQVGERSDAYSAPLSGGNLPRKSQNASRLEETDHVGSEATCAVKASRDLKHQICSAAYREINAAKA